MPIPSHPVPLYFSHSYRPSDRELNEFFWKLFCEEGFLFTVDPKSATLSVPYLELMMKRSAGFAAVIPHRPEQAIYRCSPFILFEYGLAIQAQKPLLVFVEEGVSGNYFPANQGIHTFSRHRERLSGDRDSFLKAIRLLKEKSQAYRNIDIQLRGRVGLLLGSNPDSEKCYSSARPRLERILRDMGYSVGDVSLDVEGNFKLALDLDSFDFLVLDVGHLLPPWVYPFIHGRFIPSVKLFHIQESGAVTPPSPLLTGQLVPGLASADDPILFWRDEEELLSKFKHQIKRFDGRRLQFESLGHGKRYFRSLGRGSLKVFISNASDANDFSCRLSDELSLENITHFQYKRQNSIELGSEWQAELRREVETSKIFIPIVTEGYLSSPWCRQEYQIAEQLRKENKTVIVPYFLQDVDSSFLTQGRPLFDQPKQRRIKIVVSDIDNLLKEERTQQIVSAPQDPEVDVAIITILKEEYEAVLRQLDRHWQAPSTQREPNLYAWELGEISSPAYQNPYITVLAMSGRPGTNNGVLVTLETIKRWSPRYVLLVGIAGGLHQDKLKKGDVVVSDVIWGYEYGKIEEKFKPRTNFTVQADNPLISAAQALEIKAPEWKHDVLARHFKAGTPPEIKVGAVGSGDKVIDNAGHEFFQSVLAQWPKLMAVEMEGIGAAMAIQKVREAGGTIGFAMIRGISDMPPMPLASKSDGPPRPPQTEERDTWKQYAADTAACFAVHLIRNGWPVPPRQA